MSSRRRIAAVAVLAGLVCAACVHQKDPTVQIKNLQADIVFGLKPTTTVAPLTPAAPPAPQAIAVSSGSTNQTVPTPFEIPVTLPLTFGPPPVSDCPAAALEAFPDQTAPIAVASTPPVGAYKWELGGNRVEGIGIVPVNGTETRLIRRVTKIPQASSDYVDSLDYTFQMVEPLDQKGAVLVLTYQVRTHNRGIVYEQPPAGTASVYAASPDAGLSLLSEDRIDSSGGSSPVFHPVDPLLLLPLPIQSGAQFNSVAADPSSGQVVTFQGSVLRRARVDACGTVIEGWDVNGLEKSIAPPPPSTGAPTLGSVLLAGLAVTEATDVDMIYATQFGGMLLAEHTLQAGPLGSVTVDNAIGQQKPSPLPAGTA